MRKSRMFLLVAVVAAIPGLFVLQPATDVQADPTKTTPCANTVCPINQKCCVACPGEGICLPHRAKCGPPPPFCPGM